MTPAPGREAKVSFFMQILVLNGPSLNLLGQREPEVYGTQSLGDIEASLKRAFQKGGVSLDFFQTNHEGTLVDQLHRAQRKCQAVVINPGGYAHTSIAVRDAIAAIEIPVIEVHLSNISAREPFRHHTITGGACEGVISGLGALGYHLAIEAVLHIIGKTDTRRSASPSASASASAGAGRGREERGRDDRESDDDRSGRRRRGRRGGRGRRRDGDSREDIDSDLDNAGERASDRDEHRVDIEAKYANLKGVTVQRGIDMLDSDESGDEPRVVGVVSFEDGPDEGEPDPESIRRPDSPEEEPAWDRERRPERHVEEPEEKPAQKAAAPKRSLGKVRQTGRRTGAAQVEEVPPPEPVTEASDEGEGGSEKEKKPAKKTRARKSTAKKTPARKTTTTRKRATKTATAKKSPASRKKDTE